MELKKKPTLAKTIIASGCSNDKTRGSSIIVNTITILFRVQHYLASVATKHQACVGPVGNYKLVEYIRYILKRHQALRVRSRS
jgi:hypothetical protein